MPGTSKLEMMVEEAFDMYERGGSILISLAVAGRGEVLAPGNPSKEKESFEGEI